MPNHLIHELAQEDKDGVITHWLQKDKQLLDCPDTDGNTPLHIAAFHGCIDTVQLLLRVGANFGLQNHSGYTPFFFIIKEVGIKKEHQTIIALLLQHGDDINQVDINGNTPLHLFAALGHYAMVKLLLHAGANFAFQNENGDTPLAYMMLNPDIDMVHQSIIALLLQYGDDPNQPIEHYHPIHNNAQATRLIHFALHRLDTDFLKLLLSYNADLDIPDIQGRNGMQVLYAGFWKYDIIDEDEQEYYVEPLDDDGTELRFSKYIDCLRLLLLRGNPIETRYFYNPIADTCHAEFDYSERLVDGEGIMTSKLVEHVHNLTHTTPSIDEMIEILAYPFLKEIIQDTLTFKQTLETKLRSKHFEPKTIKQLVLFSSEELHMFLKTKDIIDLHRAKKLENPPPNFHATLLGLPPELTQQIWYWVSFCTNIDTFSQEIKPPNDDQENNTRPNNLSP